MSWWDDTTTKGHIWAAEACWARAKLPWGQHPQYGDGFDVPYQPGEELPWMHLGNIDKTHSSYTHIDAVQLQNPSATVLVVKTLKSEPTAFKQAHSALSAEVNHIRKLLHIHVIEAIGSYTQRYDIGILLYPRALCNLGHVLDGFSRDPELKIQFSQRLRIPIQGFLPSIMGCLANALAYVHGQNVIHRDIKPTNVLLDGRRVMLTDFGISCAFTDTHTGSSASIPWTKRYVPPEVLDQQYHGRRQDIFSLGCVFVEIFTVYNRRTIAALTESFDDPKIFIMNLSQATEWLTGLTEEICDYSIKELIVNMLRPNQQERPLAVDIWASLASKTSVSMDVHFCGACCMPLGPDDMGPGLHSKEAPDPLDYEEWKGDFSSMSVDDAGYIYGSHAGADPNFETVYQNYEIPPYVGRKRVVSQQPLHRAEIVLPFLANHPVHRILEWPSVSHGPDLYSVRQRSQVRAAMIARLGRHSHMQKLVGTYQKGSTLATLTHPPLNLTLAEYLIAMHQSHWTSAEYFRNSQALLRESFGCLAHALRHVHDARMVMPRIDQHTVMLDGKPPMRMLLRLPVTGHYPYNTEFEKKRRLDASFAYRDTAKRHKSNERQRDPSDDIYELGDVFVAIESARRGRSYLDWTKFRKSGRSFKDWFDELASMPGYSKQDENPLDKLLLRMLDVASCRPTASEVYETVIRLETRNGPLCGICCLPEKARPAFSRISFTPPMAMRKAISEATSQMQSRWENDLQFFPAG